MNNSAIGFAFGELDVSVNTIILLVLLTIVTFAAVGISSLKLIQFDSEEEKPEE